MVSVPKGLEVKKKRKKNERGPLKLKINIYYLVLINRLKSCERGLPFVMLDYIFRSYFFDNHMLNSELFALKQQNNNNNNENEKQQKKKRRKIQYRADN